MELRHNAIQGEQNQHHNKDQNQHHNKDQNQHRHHDHAHHHDQTLDNNPAQHSTETSRRRPGRPAEYVLSKPDHLLSDKERKVMSAIIKRRIRQNRCYHRKRERQKAEGRIAAASAAENIPAQSIPDDPTASPLASAAAAPSLHQNPSTHSPAPPPHRAALPSRLFTEPAIFTSPLPQIAVPPEPHPTVPQTWFPFANDSNFTSFAPEHDASDLDTLLDEPTTSVDPIPMPLAQPHAEKRKHPHPDDSADLADQSYIHTADNEIALFEQGIHADEFRSNIDDFRRISRSESLRTLVFESVRTTYLAMPPRSQRFLRQLSIFPDTFDLIGAGAVIAPDNTTSSLDTTLSNLELLFSNNFLRYDGNRLKVNDIANLFIRDYAKSNTPTFPMETDIAKDRFVSYYTGILARLNNSAIHTMGWAREQAMHTFDVDRRNMEYTYFFAKNISKIRLREFLACGAAIMRFCVGAQARITYFRDALSGDLPPNNSPCASPTASQAATTPLSPNCQNPADRQARLEIGLGEAYLDALEPAQAEIPIRRAYGILRHQIENPVLSQPFNQPVLVDECLCLLLLANLELEGNHVDRANELLLESLRILQSRGLTQTTFAVSALSNLVSIFIQKDEIHQAKSVATNLLNVLHKMRYTEMPIYADILGVMGMVSIAEGNGREAEKQFAAALRVVESWGTKPWSATPVQHCLDLDLWLMRGMSKALAQQGRAQESASLMERAALASSKRGLETSAAPAESFGRSTASRWRSYTRHIY